ncbi:Gfo/Idh/MocA family oxidoreductase [Candidatus Bathyarchaeota archaeon]|nr:Gfo/Idh/MocA family oxidoreductase [Candidatus Bathyarchaeota archaeon]
MEKVKLGIIGLGYIGKTHLKHSLKIPNVDVVAVSDLSKKALKDAEVTGVTKTFTNYEQLLKEPDIDAVIVALPTHLHLQCAQQAAEARKHIFMEKPIALNTEEAKEIIAAAHKNSVTLMVGYPLRFNEKFQELKARKDKGLLGDVEIAYATYVSTGPFFHRADGHSPVPVPEWWWNKELTGGGALMDVGSHMINLMRWFFGEITDIKSQLNYRFNLDFEDSAICLTKFDSGTKAVITVGWFLQGYMLRTEFFGTVGHDLTEHRPGNILLTALQMLTTGKSKFHQAHLDEIQYFVDCLQNDSTPSPSGEDGLKDLEAIEKAYKNQIRLN